MLKCENKLNNNTSDNPPSKTNKPLYRGTVFFLGKQSGKYSSIFVRANSKEEAEKDLNTRVKQSLKERNLSKTEYVLKTTLSSDDEIDFFSKNKNNFNYISSLN